MSDRSISQRVKELFEQGKDQIPDDKRKEMEKLMDLKCDRDRHLSLPDVWWGEIKMRSIDREERKSIKFETENSPVPFNLWSQMPRTRDTAIKMTACRQGRCQPIHQRHGEEAAR
jgi:hypothetical protein